MNFFQNKHKCMVRAGSEYRTHKDRFFYIKKQGWFFYTRSDIEMFEGIENHRGVMGPFPTKADAFKHLTQLIGKN